MSRIGYISLLVLFLTSCGGGGVTITESKTVEYFSNAFSKSKKWFRSTDGDYISEEGPPPPSSFQPTERQVLQSRSKQKSGEGMTKSDYLRGIKMLESTIPELEKKYGKDNKEVGETYHTIGSMYLEQGFPREAKSAFEKSLKILSKWLGSEHPRIWKLKDRIKKIK
ncbi:MAG: tetratricopeptide repeat protein [Opitutales bacterium]